MSIVDLDMGEELKAMNELFKANVVRANKLLFKPLPLIAAPYKCESAMILPSLYWTRGFVRYWQKAE